MANSDYITSEGQDFDNVDNSTLHIGVDGKRSYNDSVGPTGVGTYDNQIDIDSVIIQTLEGYVLPLLPIVPLHIHNIHLKCKCETLTGSKAYYSEIQLPSYEKNIGKQQVLDIDNIPVSYVFYPNGTIDTCTKNSENPFRLQTEEDRIALIAFIRKIKDNLPHQIAVPDIDRWEFTECDINRDVRVSDLVHFAGVKVQAKHMDHLFRVYTKKIRDKVFCRVEETKSLSMTIVEAIDHIFNPYERIEKQLSEIQYILRHRIVNHGHITSDVVNHDQ
jgi:hypothetical protein